MIKFQFLGNNRLDPGLQQPDRPVRLIPGQTFQSIQALRGMAAVMVAVFHAGTRVDPTEMTFRVGNAGVDIFFVISGFIMWTVTTWRPIGPVGFLRQRFIRLVPLYWLCTIALISISLVMPSALPHMHPTLRHILLSLAFVPHVSPDTGLTVPVLGQGWTLNFEMFFYVLFAIALILPPRGRLFFIAAVLLILPMLGGLVTQPAPPVATFLSPLLVEFLGGIILAQLVISKIVLDRVWCRGCIVAGLLLLLIAAPGADDNLARLFQYGIPAFLIVGGAVGAELSGNLQVAWPFRWFGDASYSIYLSHTFAISILTKLWPTVVGSTFFAYGAVVATLLLGSFVYAMIERPIFRLMRGRRKPLPTAASA